MKIAGSYGSLIRGVSQQAPEVRIEGQHTEQVNMLSDPVAGLTRRRGTIFKANKALTTLAANQAAALGTFGGYRQLLHTTGGKDYLILMRDKSNANTSAQSLPPVMCYNVTDNAWLDVAWNGTQGDTVNNNGVAAAVSIGRYLLFSVQSLPCYIVNSSVYGVTNNHRPVVWVRGAVYDRTYTVRAPNGTTFSYTTPSSTSTSVLTPSMIAQQLGNAASAAGLVSVQVTGSHVSWNSPAYASGQDISVSDGGDGSLIRGIYDTVDSVDKLSFAGINGQIIKVQTGQDAWFYVKAATKGNVANVLTECVWREAAGTIQGQSLYGLGVGRIVGSTLYVGYGEAGNPNGLVHMPAQTEPVPTLVPSSAGDVGLNVAPRWLTHQITFMSLFQDRLLVGSDAALSVSAAGDYLNFFRSTMVTVPVSDPFEMVAQGGEDDILRWGVSYNRNLVIFGDKRQYIISGNTALTPTAANMSVMTVYPDAATCRPMAAGGQIFYARDREGSVGVHQIQPGAYVESAESFAASAQIGTYIPAPAAEFALVAGAPSLLAVRSRVKGNGLWVFSYLDAPDGRKQEAWYRWEFNPLCGNLLSAYSTANGLLLLWARQSNGTLYLVADLMPMSTTDNALPYLDSMRKANTLLGGSGEVWNNQPGWNCAFDNTTDRFLIGGTLADDRVPLTTEYPTEAPSLWAGLPFDSYVIPTNPYARDKDGKALLSGRTTVTLLRVNTRLSSGMAWEVTAGGLTKDGDFNGRRMGDTLNVIGRVPISSTIVSVPIGRETRAYSLKLMARKWFPLNLSGIEWTGQSFNRTPRA